MPCTLPSPPIDLRKHQHQHPLATPLRHGPCQTSLLIHSFPFHTLSAPIYVHPLGSTELIHLDSLQHSTSTSILIFLNHSQVEDLRAKPCPPTGSFPNFGQNIRSPSTLPCTFSFFSPPLQVLRKALDYFCGCKCVFDPSHLPPFLTPDRSGLNFYSKPSPDSVT